MAVECSELSQTVADIALNIGADPKVKSIDDVLAVMQKDFPEFQRADVVNAIVEATTRGPRVQSELAKKLNDLKREARRTSEPLIRQRLTKQIADLNRQIEAGKKDVIGRPLPAPLTKELERLAFERDMARRKLDRYTRGLKPQTAWTFAQNVGGTVRSIRTSIDLSAVFRQGGFLVKSEPKRAGRAIWPMLKAFASERHAYEAAKEIQQRPNAPLYAKAKLYLADVDAPLSAKEEAYMTNWAEKIPLVAGSERAYNTFLNKLRADSFDAMVETLSRNGEPTIEEARSIANSINVWTGRGNLGSAEAAANTLASIFFSPRYWASRIQTIAGQPLYGGSAATRKLVAKQYAKYAIGLAVVYTLATYAGGTVERDPRSSDFGKIRFGKSRIDPLTGMSQHIVFGARMLTGKMKSTMDGQVRDIRGPNVKYGKQDMADVGARYFRSKLAPIPSAAWDVATGKDVVGNPATVKGKALELVTPMSVRDVYQAIREEGVPKGTALGLLSIFGMGVQTYGKEGEPHPPPQ